MILPVDFSGQPKPTVQWFLNDQPLSSGPRVSFEGSDVHSVLTVSDLSPEDAGRYKVKITNKAGSQEAIFDINVRGRLLSPQQT